MPATHQAAISILIVDDSAVIRTGLARQLEAAGFAVMQASDGREGLAQAQRTCPDLIISDIEMPNLDGFGLCRELKQQRDTRAIPVIILSSLDSDADIEHGFEVGAAAFISKSRASSELQQCITEVLHKSALLRERRVLVVDDSATIRDIVTRGLEQEGFRVMTADDGTAALALAREHAPDLIISDLQMPNMGGAELCRTLQRDQDLAAIPFIVMSSASDRAVIRQMVAQGAAAYLIKPFNIDQLVTTAQRLLSDHYLLLRSQKETLDTERRLLIGSITSLVHALETRDRYTRGHSENVALIATGIARFMRFNESECEMITLAGRLHDLGKIGVRDSILLKPGPLTAEEFAVIKTHPRIGAEILGSIPSLAPVIPGVLHHHEHIDGNGYPDGLQDDAIPLMARIIAVADMYDSLTSDRPYHPSRSQATALQIMQDVVGTQLCPECFAHLLQWLQEHAGQAAAWPPAASGS